MAKGVEFGPIVLSCTRVQRERVEHTCEGRDIGSSLIQARGPSVIFAEARRKRARADCATSKMRTLASLLLVALGTSAADEATDCAGMRTKELRKWLAARGLKCDGCGV